MIRTVHTVRAAVLVLAAASFAACDGTGITVVPEVEQTFGFESGLEGWVVDSDVSATGSASGATTTDEASVGTGSLRLALDDDGGGTVWIHRVFDVTPERSYRVSLDFDLGSRDAGADVWSLRAGARDTAPTSLSGLTIVGNTAVGIGTAVAFERRELTFSATSDEEGRLWVVLGIEQESAGDRAFWLDDLEVELVRN